MSADKNNSKKINSITEYIAMFILSLLLFGGIDVDGLLYFLIAVSFWGLMFSRYHVCKNWNFYRTYSTMAVVNFVTYVISKPFLHKYDFCMTADVIFLFCYAVYLAVFSTIIWKRERCYCKIASALRTLKSGSGNQIQQNPKGILNDSLFQERQKDADQIRRYLERFDSIGLEGEWGCGKTFLMNYVISQPEMQDKFIFLTIHLLSVDFDDIQNIIIREIGKTLDSQHIFSSGVSGLLGWLKDNGWAGSFIKLFLPDDSTYTDAMENLKKDIARLEKKIVVVYEDIDRIQNTENIKKLFSLSENLTGASVKFVYEYDEERLNGIDEDFTHDYVEKYIPYVIRLTPIPVKHIFETAIDAWIWEVNGAAVGSGTVPGKENRLKNISMEDLDFLFKPIHVDGRLIKSANAPRALNFKPFQLSVRKVNTFLEEVDATIGLDSVYRKKKNIRVVVSYFVWKHFFYESYKKIDFYNDTSVIDQMEFHIPWDENKKSCTIMRHILLCEAEDRLQKKGQTSNIDTSENITDPDERLLTETEQVGFWDEPENRINLLILSLLGYHLDWHEVNAIRGSVSAIVNEDSQNLNKRCRNDEIDRILRSLSYRGKSSITDPQFVYQKICMEVFSKPTEEWNQSFETIWKDLYRDAYAYNDNHTIFRLGIDYMLQLFKAFDVSNASEEEWMNLLRFYFSETAVGAEDGNTAPVISNRFLQPLNYVDLRSRSVYLAVLRAFNAGRINGNLNNSLTYHNFLDKYLSALSYLGYIETGESEYFHYLPDAIGEDVEWRVFNHFRERLEQLKKTLNFSEEIADDISVALDFIEKNRELYSTEYPAPKESEFPRVQVISRSALPNQETVDRLIDGYRRRQYDEDSLKNAMLNGYRSGKLTPYEMRKIMMEIGKVGAGEM